jgi:hypothetical protein
MKRTILAIVTIVAVGAGLAGGLVYTWGLESAEEYESAPDSLHLEEKRIYLALIGDLYAYEEDVVLAEARLADLGIPADGVVLSGLIEDYLDGGGKPEEVRNLAHLAEALGASGGVLLVFGTMPSPIPPTSQAPTPTSLADPPVAGTPSAPITITPTSRFEIVERTAVCAEPGQPGTIAVWVQDVRGAGLANVEVVVSWASGQDRFYTGLRPGKGAGYADFEMKPETEYDVGLAEFKGAVAQGLASNLSPGICPTGTIALSWQVAFQKTP